jgi:BMFP domain-containing protein YqiC
MSSNPEIEDKLRDLTATLFSVSRQADETNQSVIGLRDEVRALRERVAALEKKVDAAQHSS